ncbi:hypothetical protein LEP1GSC013_0841 [Leptospira interrogans serovar Valbuzzi str. Duyster]|nr:hypothetical protein LEP1GSC013_0841 [Leptospira interrogans serovar Valbuzzi str. Duyster]ENO71800.1 hypothetical protein LEP1GSC012_2532 [Leptospira interrogans serovar Valbuzzi str. Valbuzzi]
MKIDFTLRSRIKSYRDNLYELPRNVNLLTKNNNWSFGSRLFFLQDTNRGS